MFIVKKPILYITHKVRGTMERRKRNVIAFVRLFIIILNHLSYEDAKGVLRVRLGDILELIARQSHFTLITIAIFPLALPIPYPPSIPSILAIPVFIFIINGLVGKKFIKIPQKVLNYSIKLTVIKKIVIQSKIVIAILARISKGGRIPFLADKQMNKVHLSFMLLMSLAIVFPLPGTNYLPAVAIFIIAIGSVLTDGTLIVFGYLVGVVGIFVLMLFILFGKKIILTFFHFITYLQY